jgi:peptide/nickel transport system permease protein
LKKVGTFDLGMSIQSRRPVTQELGSRIPATLLLSVAALSIESILGLVLGIYSALQAGRVQDSVIRFGCVLLASLPAFALSLILLFLFAVHLHCYEISSSAELHRLWLPAITLGLVEAPRVVRLVRANILSELGRLYVSSSLSRGLSKGLIVRGAFRNALLPVITTIALSFAHLVGGSIVIESIFNWPGLGNYAMNGILIHNYPAVQGYTVLTVATVIFINLTVEVAYIAADPRVRRRQRKYHGKIAPKYGEGETQSV